MDPNQWNTYNIQYGHAASGGLPSVHPSLNRLDLTSAGLSHQLQAGRGVPSLQAVNYPALSGLPILDTLSPLTSGLSAQGHQLVFDPQTNRISSEPQPATPSQPLVSPHHYENPGSGSSKSASSRGAGESLGRNQLLEAARMWSTSAASFTSPSSLYNQFNATLFPQSVEVSSAASSSVSPSPGHISISAQSKSSQNQLLQQQLQQQQNLHDPPPAHSSNTSSRLLPVVQRPPQHNLQAGASDLLYNMSSRANSSSTLSSSVSESLSQGSSRPGLYTTHKAVVLGVGNIGLAQLQQDTHRQTPVQQHQQQYPSHRAGEIEDLSSGNSQSHLYGSYANLASDSQNFTSDAHQHHHHQHQQHQQQHLSATDMSYEAVSPAPPMQQQQHQQPEGSMSSQQHHPALSSFGLGQFPELASLTSEHAHSLADKFQANDIRLQMDSRLQASQQQQQQHPDTLVSPPPPLHRQHGSASLKVPSKQQRTAPEVNRYQGGITVTNQSLGHVQPASQNQVLTASSCSLLNAPAAPSPVQAMADSTTKPKRSRSRKKKVDAVVTPASTGSNNPLTLSQQLHQPVQPANSNNIVQDKKSNLPQVHPQQQQQLSLPGMSMNPSSQHISTLSMANTSNQQHQLSYARAQTPSTPQNYSLGEQQHQLYQQSGGVSKTSSNHNIPGSRQQPTPSTYKQQQKKPFTKLKDNISSPSGQQPQAMQTYSQHVNNTSIQDGQGGVLNFSTDQHQHKLGNTTIQSSPHAITTDGPYGKLLSQNQMLVSEGVGYDHLLDEEENSAHQQQQHYQMEFGGQPFIDQLAGVSAPPSTSSYGGEVVLTTLVSQEESARLQQQQPGSDVRPTYHGAPVEDIRPVSHLGEQQQQQSGHLGMEDVSFGTMFSLEDPAAGQGSLQGELPPPPEPEMTLTFVPHVVEDDELGHFADPEQSGPVPMLPKQNQPQPRAAVASEPTKDSFQSSFLSYLQGHKQETLSSVSSSAVTKKPQLPKYIPEPRRPKPLPPPPPPATNKALAASKTSSLDPSGGTSKSGGGTISTFRDSSQKIGSDKEGYSVRRTSDLAVKITLPKSKNKSRFGPFADSTLLKDSMRKNKERKRKKGKFDPDEEDSMPWEFSEGESKPTHRKQPAAREVTPPPTRTSMGRKAKDKCMEMTKKNRDNSDSEDEDIPKSYRTKMKGYASDESIYNSDEDPAWNPFDVDLNQGDVLEKRKKPRRQRVRLPSVAKVSRQAGGRSEKGASTSREHLYGAKAGASKTTADPLSHAAGHLKVGTYMIEKKDLQNLESYPIWRMEENNLMKKFELKILDGRITHVASGTFSTWMPSMESQFQTIKVREIAVREQGGVSEVEVLEECRPKPQMDPKLEVKYEDDPLVDPFNVYLQVFLSQALEPNFLAVIKETNEMFYMEALNQIDGMIEKKCSEISKLARWKAAFQEALHRCPLMKEIDRPNLKQACQASENPSPPSIKSVFLSGLPYDKFLLTDKPGPGPNNPQEFMIGKVAAHYVRAYHSLYHFKYWLRQRCDAKVKMTKESNKSENLSDEVILDKCLENRNWVLQLFDNLKSLLRGSGDAPS